MRIKGESLESPQWFSLSQLQVTWGSGHLGRQVAQSSLVTQGTNGLRTGLQPSLGRDSHLTHHTSGMPSPSLALARFYRAKENNHVIIYFLLKQTPQKKKTSARLHR